MRQLFLPACVCFVAWSGATNSNPRFSLDEFTATLSTDKTAYANAAPETASRTVAEPASAEPAPTISSAPHDNPTAAQIADLISGLAIEFPVPSGKVVNNGEPAGIPLPPIAKPVIARTTEEICDTLAYAAQDNDLPAAFFIRLLFQESRFKPGVVSSAGAQGVAQFMPQTAADMGLDNPFDPVQAIPASARLLRNLTRQFGNLGLAAAAYNAGPKRIQDWLADRRKNKLPEETQGYVKTITGHAAESWTKASARHPGEKLPRRAPCQEAAGLLAWNGPDAVPLPAPSPQRAAAHNGKDKEKEKPAAVKQANVKQASAKAATLRLAAGKNQPQETPKRKRAHKPERLAQC